ncbi:MAG: hypothetical protein PW792_00960 [Acidobacteriaceae bacterium]|nr:hypothetical protein [Acidobacteriaceae bacterium]
MRYLHGPIAPLLLLVISGYFFAAWFYAPLSLWMVPRHVRAQSREAVLHRGYRWFLVFVGILLVGVALVLVSSDWHY